MQNIEMYKMAEIQIDKLRRKGNFLFRAFVLNYVIILLAWLVYMTGFYDRLIAHFITAPAALIEIIFFGLFAIWKILAFVFFLIPALAAWWEMSVCKKKLNK